MKTEYPKVSNVSIPTGYLPPDIADTYFANMDKHEQRRLKLRCLINSRCGGVNANLAREIGKEPSYINRLLYPAGKKGAKRIGDEIIFACTEAFNLPPGWFDTDDEREIFETGNKNKQELIRFILSLPDDDIDEKRIGLIKSSGLIDKRFVSGSLRILHAIKEPEAVYSSEPIENQVNDNGNGNGNGNGRK